MSNHILQQFFVLFLGICPMLGNTTFAQNKTDTLSSETSANTYTLHSIFQQTSKSIHTDSITSQQKFFHRIGIETRPGSIFPTSSFFRNGNLNGSPIENSLSLHLKYSFRFHPETYTDRIYRGVYQGIGLAYYNLYAAEQLGTPLTLYLFQGARIARFNQRLSFNYEWNFGVSFGWKPYDEDTNRDNTVIGSKVNAYLNTNVYLNWTLSPHFNLTTGVAATHFSNGNTQFPNAGLNNIALSVGLIYNMNKNPELLTKPSVQESLPTFPRHISYDLILFGSWRRKGVEVDYAQIPSPEAYPVVGFNFAPMYNFGYKFRAGISLDGVYDSSANVYSPDGHGNEFSKPHAGEQMALGLSGRAEYVMPYFTVGIGLGTNIIHAGGDLKSFYQTLALKIELTRSSFLHIGYNLQNFHDPNYLMLGVGFRFHNKYPAFHRR